MCILELDWYKWSRFFSLEFVKMLTVVRYNDLKSEPNDKIGLSLQV